MQLANYNLILHKIIIYKEKKKNPIYIPFLSSELSDSRIFLVLLVLASSMVLFTEVLSAVAAAIGEDDNDDDVVAVVEPDANMDSAAST